MQTSLENMHAIADIAMPTLAKNDEAMSFAPLASFVPLIGELSDLKRIVSADRTGSIATRLFFDGWKHLVAGVSIEMVMQIICARALAACRLGDLDRAVLTSLGLDEAKACEILKRSFDAVSAPVDSALAVKLRCTLDADTQIDSVAPNFCKQLARQPRAGITCPDRARIMLQPEENHAEHCLVVAVASALIAPLYGAEPANVFLAGMCHHFHSATMPDSGFTGEMLLGDVLDTVINAAREAAMSTLPHALTNQIRPLLAEITSDHTPLARAFHAADVLDRVIEIKHHLKGAGLTMNAVLNEYELVHAGPVKAFHDTVLFQAGLA